MAKWWDMPGWHHFRIARVIDDDTQWVIYTEDGGAPKYAFTCSKALLASVTVGEMSSVLVPEDCSARYVVMVGEKIVRRPYAREATPQEREEEGGDG